MSQRTLFLAKLIGLYFLVVSFAMFIRGYEIIGTMTAIIQNPALLFVTGLVGVVAGLAIVIGHNVWRGGALPVLITLLGWISLLKGAMLLLLSPETETRIFMVGLHYNQHPYPFAAILLVLGGYLTFAGFRN